MNKYFFIFLLPVIVSCNNQKTEHKTSSNPSQSVATPYKAEVKNGLSMFEEGDLIFQSTSGGQGLAIRIATGSPYSHVGILLKKGEKLVVYEAVQPVKITSLEKFIARGDNAHYVIKRLKENKKILSAKELASMQRIGEKQLGKDYDLYFEWSDQKMYCSELVWKIYKEGAGLEIGKLQKLKDFNLSNPVVQYKLKERYGKNIPYQEKVISPSAIFECDIFEEVYRSEKVASRKKL